MSLGDTRCILVCVNYSDMLSVSLEFNRPHFKSTLVVTHPHDTDTIDVASRNGAEVFMTDAFYRRGAVFNKFAAMELGLDYMGREGWIAIMDADILMPRTMKAWTKRPGCLYTPRRRMHLPIPQSVGEVPLERRWRQWKYPMGNEEFAGYCQIFHATDSVLGPAPWHNVNWTWAGGADSFFHQKWNDRNKVRPPFEVLHLGPAFTNWAGRVSPYADGRIPPESAKNADMFKVLLRGRHGKSGMDRYEKELLKNEVGNRSDIGETGTTSSSEDN